MDNPWLQKLLEYDEWNGRLRNEAIYSRGIYSSQTTHATVMPPSIFCDWIKYKYVPEGLKAKVSAEWQLNPSYRKVMDKWRGMHPNHYARMATYRSRLSFAYGPLRANEVDKQIARSQEGSSRLQSLLQLLEEDEREALIDIWVDVMLEASRKAKIGEHTFNFIRDHKSSSFTPGRKWPSITREELDLALEANIKNIEQIAERRDQLRMSKKGLMQDPSQYNRGIRGRNISFESVSDLENQLLIDLDVEYARLIRYFMGRNINPFLEESTWVYKELVSRTAKLFDVEKIIHCPIHDGARIYEKLYKAAEGNFYYNHDAKGFDGHVATILDNGAIAIPEGIAKMGSGMDTTSANGSMAHIVWFVMLCRANRGLIDIVVMLAILSDDGGWVTDQSLDTKILDVPGIYAEDKDGSEMMHYLGYSMLDDEYWHPVGIKLAIEDPDKGVKIQPYEWSLPLVSEYDDVTRRSVECIYMGETLDGTPMREILNKANILKLDYLSPSNIQDLILKQQLAEKNLDFRPDLGDSDAVEEDVVL